MLRQVHLLTLEMLLWEDLPAPGTFLQITEGVFPSFQGGVLFGVLLLACCLSLAGLLLILHGSWAHTRSTSAPVSRYTSKYSHNGLDAQTPIIFTLCLLDLNFKSLIFCLHDFLLFIFMRCTLKSFIWFPEHQLGLDRDQFLF